MTSPVIQVDSLGKKYLISHRPQGHGRYLALRDVLLQRAKGWGNRWWRQTLPHAHGSAAAEEFWALKEVSFQVNQGDVVGIMGRNGAGKSTLLKILSRITVPTTGQIHLRGRIASLLEVGTGFHPELTGRENIFLNGALLGMGRSEIRARFDEIVAFAEVERFLDTPVKRYSSGMYMRLAFAVAAHLEPEILVVDEVLAVGDAGFQKKCLGKMGEVGRSGRTVLLVSHNLATLQHLCQRALVLDRGQLLTQGQVDHCIKVYTDQIGVRTGQLLDHQKAFTPQVKVIGAEVNGSSADHLHLAAGRTTLEVAISLTVQAPCRVSLEVRLKDWAGNCLACSLPGQVDPEKYVYSVDKGTYKIVNTILLPDLHKGSYLLDIFITDPGCQGHVDFDNAVRLDVDGWITKTGLVFEQSLSKNGFQSLTTYGQIMSVRGDS